jgi:hypothetical protein
MIIMENASSYRSPAISIIVGDMTIDSSSSTHDHGGDENNKLSVSVPPLLLRVWIQGATVLCILEGSLLVLFCWMIITAWFGLMITVPMLAIMLSPMVPGDTILLLGMIVLVPVVLNCPDLWNCPGLWTLFVGGLVLRPFINHFGNFHVCCVVYGIMSIVVVFRFDPTWWPWWLMTVPAMIGVCTIEMWNRYHVRQFRRAAILGLAPWLPLMVWGESALSELALWLPLMGWGGSALSELTVV